jgi:competence protein ComEA
MLALAVAALAVMPAAAQTPTPSQAKISTSAAAKTTPVNLNTATQAELETLPGIGPRAAQRILEYRQKNGSFKKIEELMNVKGIGEKSFLKLKPLITVSGGRPAAAEKR